MEESRDVTVLDGVQKVLSELVLLMEEMKTSLQTDPGKAEKLLGATDRGMKFLQMVFHNRRCKVDGIFADLAVLTDYVYIEFTAVRRDKDVEALERATLVLGELKRIWDHLASRVAALRKEKGGS